MGRYVTSYATAGIWLRGVNNVGCPFRALRAVVSVWLARRPQARDFRTVSAQPGSYPVVNSLSQLQHYQAHETPSKPTTSLEDITIYTRTSNKKQQYTYALLAHQAAMEHSAPGTCVLLVSIEFQFIVPIPAGSSLPWIRSHPVIADFVTERLKDTVPIFSSFRGHNTGEIRDKLAQLRLTAWTDIPQFASWKILDGPGQRAIATEDPPGY